MTRFPGRQRCYPAERLPEAVAAAIHEATVGGRVVCAPGGDPSLWAWAAAQGLPLFAGPATGAVDPWLGEVPPVDLTAVPRSGQPPWPAASDPETQVQAVLDWLDLHGGPFVVLPTWPATPAMLAVAAALAGEGRRVVWRWPAGQALTSAHVAELNTAAARGWPLKLIADMADFVPDALPPGWWVAASGDPAEISAVLAQHLRDEFPFLFLVAPAIPASWPASEVWIPGQGRCLRSGPGPVTVVSADAAPDALAGPGPVYQVTSLAPQALLPAGRRRGRFLPG